MELVVDAIHDTKDLLRLLFSLQTLRRVLSLGDSTTIESVMTQYGDRLGIRLVSLLRHGINLLPELPVELLWSLVNLTSIKGHEMTKTMVQSGLVKITTSLVGSPDIQITELSLTLLANLADEPDARHQICALEQFESNDLKLTEKIKRIFEGTLQPYSLEAQT